MVTDPKLLHCPALVTIRLISGKWKTRILWLLRSGPMQFGALRRELPGVSGKVLTDHLRALEVGGLISREAAKDGKIALAFYDFTPYGRTLIPALDALGDWGLVHEGMSGGAA